LFYNESLNMEIDCLAGTNIEFDNPRAQNGVIKTCEFTDDEQDIEIE